MVRPPLDKHQNQTRCILIFPLYIYKFFLFSNNLISERQVAYLKGDSIIYQLIHIVHYIRSCLVPSKIVQGAFLYINAAFDKVWHNSLIAKLKLELKAIFLIYSNPTYKSYNRKQCVVVDGIKSSMLDIKAGVPQGS